MKELRTIEGRWHIHGADEPAQYGILHYNPTEGLRLEVSIPQEATFAEVFQQPDSSDWHSAITIHGFDAANKAIRLFGCRSSKSSRAQGMQKLTFEATRALIGIQSGEWEDLKYAHVKLRFSLLHAWLGRTGIKTQDDKEEGWKIAVKRPDDISFQLSDGITVLLRAAVQSSDGNEGIRISEDSILELEFSQPVAANVIFSHHAWNLARFLSLMTGAPVSIDIITFLVPEDGFDLGGGVVAPHEVELLQGNPAATKANRDLKTRNMRANYKEIAAVLPKALESWFRLWDKPDWKAVVGLYSSVVYNDALNLSQRFLMLAQALEVYHGATGRFETKELPTSDFQVRRDRILDLISNEADKEWVKSKMHNYRTLAQKLTEMMTAAPAAVENLIDDIPAFCALIRETRNYYTHFNRELLEKKKVAVGAQLMKLTYEMCAVLEILLLNDLGISGTPLDRIVQKVKSLSFHEG